MKRREVFLIIPTLIFTECAFIAIQLTLEMRWSPKLFLRAQFWHPLSPTKQKWRSQEVPQWLGQQRVVVSIPALLAGVRGRRRQLRARPASPCTAPHPGLAELHPGPGRAPQPSLAELHPDGTRGRQKGWLSSPCFRNYICEITAGTRGSGALGTQTPERKITVSQGCYGACFYLWRAVRLR